MDYFEIWWKIDDQELNAQQICNLLIFPISYRSLAMQISLELSENMIFVLFLPLFCAVMAKILNWF